MGKQSKKTLFFINGVAPTEEEQAIADEINGNVCFRNVVKYREEDALEDFDFVAGEVPEKYAKEAARRERDREALPEAPKASTTAPAAPQQAKAGATAAPTGQQGGGSAWKSN